MPEAADAPFDQAGLAGLTAALWDKGTQQLTATQLAEAIDALGTSVSISVGTNTTQLGFAVESGSFPQMMDLMGTMVTAPRLAAEDFDREKKLQLGDLASGPDSASWTAARVLPMLLFGREHPYARPDDGFEETLEQLAREDVERFYEQHFTPGNSVLVVVGDIELEDTIRLLEKTLGKWQGSSTRRADAEAKPSESGTVYVVHKPGAVQSVIAAGRPWKDRSDSTYYATRIGNRVLGGDFLSRLNQNLRQRNGFTYGARSGFDYYEQGSAWNLMTAVRAEVTGAALHEIAKELRDAAQTRPLTRQEVADARSAEVSVFPQSFETPSSIASVLTQLAIFHLPDSELADFETRLTETSADEVAEAMAELVDGDHIQMLIVGDKEVVTPQLEAAGFANIKYLDADGHPWQDD